MSIKGLYKVIKPINWNIPENINIITNVCCICGKTPETLYHLKDHIGIYGDYCNVCFNKANDTLVKHKQKYKQRYITHDRQINSTDRKYVIFEYVE